MAKKSSRRWNDWRVSTDGTSVKRKSRVDKLDGSDSDRRAKIEEWRAEHPTVPRGGRLQPPTQKQLDFIDALCRKLNTWTPEPANRAQASQMIDSLKSQLHSARTSEQDTPATG